MLNRHAVVIASCAATAFLMLRAADPIYASENAMRATIGKPALIALPASAESETGAGNRIIVTIDEYEPSKHGPVTVVVSVRCGDSVKEIGRFGIFPDQAFSTANGSNPQRFGFPLPQGSSCKAPRVVIIELEAQAGNGAGASLTAGSVSVE